MAVSSNSVSRWSVLVGTTICRRTSFLLDKFLSNQREIQEFSPDCGLVLSTDEADLAAELKRAVSAYHLRGEVVEYETVKPAYARSYLWSLTCGREALRQHFLSYGAEYLLLLDGDMVLEPSAVNILQDRIRGYDVIWSGFRFLPKDDLRFAGGCIMINRKILARNHFRCHEFGNGELIFEDELFDMDSFKCRARVKKGVFLAVKHYRSEQEYSETRPQPVGWFRRLTNSPVARYVLMVLR